jgi:hypothetical protein
MTMRDACVGAAAACALGALAGSARGQTLFERVDLATGTQTLSGVPAPAGAQWSELGRDGTAEANAFAGFLHDADIATNARVADDFTVPAGRAWTVTALEFYAYQTGSGAQASPFTGVNVRVWRGRPGDLGAAVVAQYPASGEGTLALVSSAFAGLYRVFNTVAPPPGVAPVQTRPIFRNRVSIPALELTSGTYWLDWQTAGSAAFSGPWAPAVTYLQTRAPFPPPSAAPGNARQFFSGVWSDLSDPGLPEAARDVVMELPFAVLGTSRSVCCVDYNADGELTFEDVLLFVAAFNARVGGACAPGADANDDGEFTFDDIQLFVSRFNAGC